METSLRGHLGANSSLVSFRCLASHCGFLLGLLVERTEKFMMKLVQSAGRAHFDPRSLLFVAGGANLTYILVMAGVAWGSDIIGLGNALYMALITFTTVGLGDYSPPFFNPGRPLWFQALGYLWMSVFLLMGLALLSVLLR